MWRQIFMTRAEVWAKKWAKNWANFSAYFRASFAVQNDPQIFSPNSSQFITPCLVVEILKFLLRELLGFGGHKRFRSLFQGFSGGHPACKEQRKSQKEKSIEIQEKQGKGDQAVHQNRAILCGGGSDFYTSPQQNRAIFKAPRCVMIPIAESLCDIRVCSANQTENITRVSRNLAFAQRKKVPFLAIFCLFPVFRAKKVGKQNLRSTLVRA